MLSQRRIVGAGITARHLTQKKGSRRLADYTRLLPSINSSLAVKAFARTCGCLVPREIVLA